MLALRSYISFNAVNPERLIDILKEKEEETKKILPKLKQLHKTPEDQHGVTLYHGKKGVKSVFLDIIREGKDNDVFGDEGIFSERMPHFSKFFIKEQDRKKIKTRMISGIEGLDKIKPYSKGTSYKHAKLSVTSPVSTNVYGDKIAIIIWSRPPEAVVIKSKAAAQSYRDYFEIMWKSA